MADPYRPPADLGDGSPQEIDEEEALKPPWQVRTAWISVAATGFLAVVSGGQLLMAAHLFGALQVVPFAQIALGVAAIVVGGKLLKMRGWAALAGLVVSGLLALGASWWIGVALYNGMFSVLQLMVPLVGFGAAVLSGLAVPACSRAEEARRQLAEQGIDASF